jgi:hypothetical protein
MKGGAMIRTRATALPQLTNALDKFARTRRTAWFSGFWFGVLVGFGLGGVAVVVAVTLYLLQL